MKKGLCKKGDKKNKAGLSPAMQVDETKRIINRQLEPWRVRGIEVL